MQTKENELQGLVMSYHGSTVTVRDDSGELYQCHLRRNQSLPVVGDHVVWQLEKDQTGIITGILPRKSELARGDGHGGMKAIAANLDLLVIVMSPPPVFSEYLIDRYLIAAELLKIKPIIVLNKVDLLDEPALAAVKKRLEPYQAIPYDVVLSTTTSPEGLFALSQVLRQQCAVLVGPSGVGKSSIIAALSQQAGIQTRDVSPKGAGKHTTTATRLYLLADGGRLIDSPGVREFNLWSVDKAVLLAGFPEFRPYLGGCKFRDCMHVIEPGCAVRSAVDSGKISATRYENFQALMKKATNPSAK